MLDVIREQLNRRQTLDSVSRNLLRVMVVACGYSEIRVMATNRLEMWLQNPKVISLGSLDGLLILIMWKSMCFS